MAKTETTDYSRRHGKMNKSDDVVYRMRNGVQQSYKLHPSSVPASKAQKAHRSHFGAVNTIVNAIMADPTQVEEWELKRQEFNRDIPFYQKKDRRNTTRSFVFATISEQLAQKASIKRRKNPLQKALPKGLRLRIKHFAELTTTELYEILKARFAVFYMEQHCYYQDMDNKDYQAIHLSLHRRGRVIAYARLFPSKEPRQWIAGRMLTMERGKGYGKYIMEQVLLEAKRQGATSLLIHAQTQAAPFYESIGFSPVGSIFTEADMPHIQMKKELQ